MPQNIQFTEHIVTGLKRHDSFLQLNLEAT